VAEARRWESLATLLPLLLGTLVVIAGIIRDELVWVVVGAGFLGVKGIWELATACTPRRMRGME
jgi:hypothetical protein